MIPTQPCPDDRRRACEACGDHHPDSRIIIMAVDDLVADLRLCPTHISQARNAMFDWLRRLDRAASSPGRRRSDHVLAADVRAWAASRGYPVARTGAISRQLIELYAAQQAGCDLTTAS